MIGDPTGDSRALAFIDLHHACSQGSNRFRLGLWQSRSDFFHRPGYAKKSKKNLFTDVNNIPKSVISLSKREISFGNNVCVNFLKKVLLTLHMGYKMTLIPH